MTNILRNRRALIWLVGIVVFSVSFIPIAGGQSLPVGMPVLEDYYLREQLLGRLDSNSSFAIRPVFPAASFNEGEFSQADSLHDLEWDGVFGINIPRRVTRLKGLPLTVQQQYISHHPYGWNDGTTIPAIGYQTKASFGVYTKLGPLSIQLMPDYVYAENRDRKQYEQLSWGQSSVRITFNPVSLGLSNENLWWGPGKYNSLLMSNTAPGFKHLTLNTVRPVSTPLGSFESQMIAGRLEGFGLGTNYTSSRSKPRYLSGFVFSYQPRWVPGLFVGMSRIFQIYYEDLGNRFSDYIPVLGALQKVNTVDEDAKRRDQLISVWGRWLFQKAHAEVYFEYGKNDHSHNFRDFIMSPEHSRAYLMGFVKMVPWRDRKDEYIKANLEITQLQQAIDYVVRNAGSWYTHYQVTEGYTHRGQILGAGIGPGGNLQTLDISWVRGLDQAGLKFERQAVNKDYYIAYYYHQRDAYKPWVDLGATAYWNWSYRHLLVNASLSYIRSLNYEWRPSAPSQSISPNVSNIAVRFGLTYRL